MDSVGADNEAVVDVLSLYESVAENNCVGVPTVPVADAVASAETVRVSMVLALPVMAREPV